MVSGAGIITLLQLDGILRLLYNHRAEKHFVFEDIAKLVTKETSFIDFGDILSILTKLHKDGYIEYDDRAVEPDDSNKNARVYKVTFEGRFWIENGGYEANRLRQAAESNRLDKLDKSQRQFRQWTIWLTAILAVGTVIAALYYATELYWNHGWFHFR